MSGHSKWAKIHRQKGAADAKRGAVFTKLGNAITVAARSGGGDPEANFKLKLAIEKAKASNMPKDNIERAIARGTAGTDGKALEQITYEGFGPAGVACIVECLTDSRNRASSNMKHLFLKYGGSIGAPNSVMWQFENSGSLGVAGLTDADELELIDAGALNIERENNRATITCLPNDLKKMKDWLESRRYIVEFAELELKPKNTVIVRDAQHQKSLELFLQELEDSDDVSNYFTNAVSA